MSNTPSNFEALIDDNQIDKVFALLVKDATRFSGYQDLRDEYIYDRPAGRVYINFKRRLKTFINNKLEFTQENEPINPPKNEGILTVPSIEKLEGHQFETLTNIIVNRYTNRTALVKFVRFKLNQNLNTITENQNLSDSIFKLIEHYEAIGELQFFIQELYNVNPKNERLRAFITSL